MSGVNKVILLGRVGGDPETRYLPNGNAVTNISLATSESWKDKDSGEKKERTEWHKVSFFGRIAEIAGEYLKKGSQVYIEGRLQTRKYQKDGVDHYTTEVVVDMMGEMQMLGGKQDGGSAAKPAATRQSTPSAPAAPRLSQSSQSSSPPNHDGYEDDIPF